MEATAPALDQRLSQTDSHIAVSSFIKDLYKLCQNRFMSNCLGKVHFKLESDPMILRRSDQNIIRSEVDRIP